MFIDRYGRRVTHMRISVTNRCNHNCIFCHREGVFDSDPKLELSPSDWGFVASVGVEHGIKYYKLTGGEPLVRNDIVEIVREITNAGGIVSMVTNGSLLYRYIDGLVSAGIEHINISLHSMDPMRFKRITGGVLEEVLKGIEKTLEYDIKVKLDYVVLSWNIDEYQRIIEYVEEKGIDLNIIELIPLGLTFNEWRDLHKNLDPIIDYLEEKSVKKIVREFQSRPVYILPSGVEITVIKGVCNPELCMKCTRLRMTPEGYIKTCLYRREYIDARQTILERNRKGFIESIEKAVETREPFFKPGQRIGIEEILKYIGSNEGVD